MIVWQDENSTLENSTFKGTIGAVSYNYTPPSFANDSWSEIAANVKNNPAAYEVGSTKTLKVYDNPNGETTNGTYKEYTVRVANNTTPEECTTNKDFSQTACGFVVEFVDIVENRQMNISNTNVDGWPKTAMRTYANKEFYNKLPEELREVIIDTKVVSGHGSSDKNAKRTDGNWESTDKIYLLSRHEVYEEVNNSLSSSRDTAYNQTRQLDYYKNLEVTIYNYSGAIKKNNGSTSGWWFRGARSDYSNNFLSVSSRGTSTNGYADKSDGLAPAFRIG